MKKKVKFREGDQVIVRAQVGPNGTLTIIDDLSAAKMIRPKVEVGDHLYEVAGWDEDNVSAGGTVIALFKEKAWIENNGREEVVEINGNSRTFPRSEGEDNGA